MLQSLSAIYHDGGKINVEFGDDAAVIDPTTVQVAPNIKDVIGKQVSGPNELRLICNQLSHEVEHLRETPNPGAGPRQFAAKYPEQPQLAAAVRNIVEDAYIDYSRTERFRGLRKAQAFEADKVMANPYRRPRLSKLGSKAHQMVEGLVQVMIAGKAKDLDATSDEVAHFVTWSKDQIHLARTSANPEVRETISERLTDMILRRLDEEGRDEANQYAKGEVAQSAATDGIPDMIQPELQALADALDLDEVRSNIDMEQASGQAQDYGMGSDEMSRKLGNAATDEATPDSDDWYDLPDDADYEEADEDWERRFAKLQDEIGDDVPDLVQRMRDRDERAEKLSSMSTEGESIREHLVDTGLAREVEEAFRELKTRDRDIPARSGHRVNMRNAVRYAAGDRGEKRLYLKRQNAEAGDRAVSVSVDCSGSMDMLAAKRAIGALHVATEAIGDELLVSGWTTRDTAEQSDEVVTPLVNAPGEQWEWDHLDSIDSEGLTPTASGIEDAFNLLKHTTKPEEVMIVLTDGKPNVQQGGGQDDDAAIAESREMVRSVRQKGVKVIGLAVGTGVNRGLMREIFGADGHLIVQDEKQLADKLVEIYRGQMKVTQ